MSHLRTVVQIMRRRMSMLVISLTVLIVFVSCGSDARELTPSGINPDLFPEQTFDASAPFCLPEREPCGFYSFSLHGRAPFKWIKSWCRCAPKYDCIYDRTDMKMRVYRQICVSKDEAEDEQSEEVPIARPVSQPHRSHKIHRHVSLKQQYPFLA
ncbi:hypothetical protein DdX_08736 [Ditylenchus destructor]|uniref:Uncharacterized protein n=1 Tax=Ditylenchus destructor TaxID=166010 RepID=A0AAD4R3P3_9BILA|nr:hypothetical protein DdX_08736 [Ditylenchus destructor]